MSRLSANNECEVNAFSVCVLVCFQGEIAELRVVGNPRAAERLCDDEDDSDAVSVSFFRRFGQSV